MIMFLKNKIGRSLKLFAVGTCIFAMTSCVVKETRVESPTITIRKTTTTTEYVPQRVYSREELFINEVYTTFTQPIYLNNGELIDIALIICDGLAVGMNAESIIDSIINSTDDSDTQILFTVVSGLGIKYFCPSYAYLL